MVRRAASPRAAIADLAARSLGVQSFVRPIVLAVLSSFAPAFGAALTAQQPVLVVSATQDPQPAPPAANGNAGGAAGGERQDGDKPADDKAAKKPSKPGIAVEDPLVHQHCARCHALDDKQQMTRISYVRKSPEGWAETLKRMIRLHGLQMSPGDAKQVVRSLSNSHGLARSEAERGLYESEKRVHWSEENQDQDFRRACAECHPLGRVLLQQRDEEEWQLLRATHVAMFPLARGQMGGGPPEEDRRGMFGGGGGGGGGGGAAPAGAGGGGRGGRGGGGGNNAGGNQGGAPAGPTQSVGDRVLAKLAKDQPLFSPAWDAWAKNRRSVPLAGTWTVSGHETGRGDLFGTAVLVRTDDDEYEVRWSLRATDGSTIERTGKGILYAGYSWRGRSQDQGAAQDAPAWREVLLLDDDWRTLKGRLFTGNHDEVGADVLLQRDLGRPRVLALDQAAIVAPSTGHRLVVHGEAFPATLAPADFFVGAGLTITAVERESDRRATLVVDAAGGIPLGPRTIAFRDDPRGLEVTLYDTVDYVRVRPLQGFARIGGAKHPRQIERFEAYAVHRGKDEKPYTDDDVDLFQVRPKWSLGEFKVRENDDDLQYVGGIDPATGVFTPNVDGPNPQRKWQANNIGDVFAIADVELEVGERPIPPKPVEKPKAADKPAEKPADQAAGGHGDQPAGEAKPAEAKPAEAKPPETKLPNLAPATALPKVVKSFRARSHLLVSVPLYARWQVLDWEDR
jgi:quinohemoprotein amine dehydrogenase